MQASQQKKQPTADFSSNSSSQWNDAIDLNTIFTDRQTYYYLTPRLSNYLSVCCSVKSLINIWHSVITTGCRAWDQQQTNVGFRIKTTQKN